MSLSVEEIDKLPFKQKWVALCMLLLRHCGWVQETPEQSFKLIHPRGLDWHRGALFCDGVWKDEFYSRIAVMLSWQTLPAHHHDEEGETFKVIHGMVQVSTYDPLINPEMIPVALSPFYGPGEYFSVEPGQIHAVTSGDGGCVFVGVCHRSHLRDVHWDLKPHGEPALDANEQVSIASIPAWSPPAEAWRGPTFADHFADVFAKSKMK
jgi:hypothetical protein